MNLRRLRASEYVPPAPTADARAASGAPSWWARPIAESGVDALTKRAEGVARELAARGNARGAAELRRTVAMLQRADALHNHAFRVETLAQMLRALDELRADLAEIFGPKSALATASTKSALEDESMVWVQAGAPPSDECAASAAQHGPAFRETAALRNRAFRLLEQRVCFSAASLRGARRSRAT